MSRVTTKDFQEYFELMMVHIRTKSKFDAIQSISPMPEFKQDYEYVDYALYVLRETMVNYGKEFPSFLEVSPFAEVKSAGKSVNARNIGNSLYKDGHFLKAHRLYTQSISCAPFGSTELALAYGNRSAVLFMLDLFKECLEDIERAMASNYPKEKQFKLLVRQRQAERFLPAQDKTPYHGPLPKIMKKNSNIPSAADCIEVKESQEFGRHIVATKEIKPGQLLLVEKPHANTVNFGYDSLFCSECLELCYTLIPCEKCRLLYCSEECRKKAFVDYHRYECAILTHFGYDIINWTVVRITLKGAKAYEQYSQLFTNEHSKNIKEDILLEAAAAAKVFYVLKNYTDFFSEFDIDDNENVLKNMYLKNLKGDTIGFDVRVNTLMHQVTTIGCAIYPTLSLFNHACNENVVIFFYGSSVVVRASCKIKRGEQCFINFGENPVINSREDRRMHLEKIYKFVCKCQACIENWPIFEDTLTIQNERLIEELMQINRIILCEKEKMYDRVKQFFLQRTLEISEVLKSKTPFLLYQHTSEIVKKLFSDGNYIDELY